MSIVDFFMFCWETSMWTAPAILDELPACLIADEL